MRFNLAIFVFVLVLSGVASAGDTNCPLPKGKVSMDVKKAPIAEVLSFLFKEAKMNYELSENPALNKTVSIGVKNTELCEVFAFAMSEANLGFKIRVE